jgi:hypothetical protein
MNLNTLMKRKFIPMNLNTLTLACLVFSAPVLAYEGTAKPLYTKIDPALALRLPSCPTGTPLFVRGDKLVCGPTPTTRSCPSNQLMVGLQADGGLICRPVPKGCTF